MAELSRHYGLPVFGTAAETDSKIVDAQAGAEYMGSLLVAAMAGTNLIHDVGYLDSGLTGSLESLVLGAEQIRWVKHFIAGLRVDAENLSLDPIDQVGPAKQFLDHPHTLAHLRETMWRPYTTDRDGWDAWVAAGAKDYGRRARDYARRLVATHQPAAIDASLDGTLRQLAHLP